MIIMLMAEHAYKFKHHYSSRLWEEGFRVPDGESARHSQRQAPPRPVPSSAGAAHGPPTPIVYLRVPVEQIHIN